MNPLKRDDRVNQSIELLIESYDDLQPGFVDIHFHEELNEDGERSISSYTQFISPDHIRYGVFALWKLIDGLWELMEFRTGEMR